MYKFIQVRPFSRGHCPGLNGSLGFTMLCIGGRTDVGNYCRERDPLKILKSAQKGRRTTGRVRKGRRTKTILPSLSYLNFLLLVTSSFTPSAAAVTSAPCTPLHRHYKMVSLLRQTRAIKAPIYDLKAIKEICF